MQSLEEMLLSMTQFSAKNYGNPNAMLTLVVRIEDGKPLWHAQIASPANHMRDFPTTDASDTARGAVLAELRGKIEWSRQDIASLEQSTRTERERLPAYATIAEQYAARGEK